MQELSGMIKKRAAQLLENGTVNRVLGWKKGQFCYDPEPYVFASADELENLVYNDFCGSNLSKYLIEETKNDGKICVLLRPCDTYSFNQLLTEHRVDREKVFVLGIECNGKLDIDKIKECGIKSVKSAVIDGDNVTVNGDKVLKKVDCVLEKCKACKGSRHVVFDELVLSAGADDNDRSAKERFAEVARLEAMTPEERFSFWRNELSKCIRCNACRNVCPACSCRTCVFDNERSGVASKANTDTFEENMFHIIRAFHVAGRCTDCGECSRVCPQGIPLHLLNRKFIKDIDELYGDYQAGEEAFSRAPLVNFTKEDAEPSIVMTRGEEK